MPAIPTGSLVLVTGASGFIAVHTVQAFLDAGYPVRGTVRSKEKGEYLVHLFKDSPAKFEYAVVQDIAQPGAFDQAVKGVVGVAHTASPFHFNAEDPDELIVPAVNGTVGVLKSIAKNNPTVQRVVITSSCASVMSDGIKPPHTYTEKDWNESSVADVEKKGVKAAPGSKYRASKTLAEKAFWKYIDDEKPTWDGATICPPMVYGPIKQQVAKPQDLNTSNLAVLDWFTGNKTQADIPSTAMFNWVDVRDVALAHVRALTVPAAGGNRFITSAGPGSPNDLVLAFEHHYPDRKTFPKGDASKVASINAGSNVFDNTRAKEVLGIKFHDIDTTIHDTVDSFIARFGI